MQLKPLLLLLLACFQEIPSLVLKLQRLNFLRQIPTKAVLDLKMGPLPFR